MNDKYRVCCRGYFIETPRHDTNEEAKNEGPGVAHKYFIFPGEDIMVKEACEGAKEDSSQHGELQGIGKIKIEPVN